MRPSMAVNASDGQIGFSAMPAIDLGATYTASLLVSFNVIRNLNPVKYIAAVPGETHSLKCRTCLVLADGPKREECEGG